MADSLWNELPSRCDLWRSDSEIPSRVLSSIQRQVRGVQKMTSPGIQTPRAVRPPVVWLWAAGGAIVLALVLSRTGSVALEFLGYLIASFGAVGMLVMFRVGKMKASQNPYYVPVKAIGLWTRILGGAVLLACALCSWPIATSLARG